MTRSQPGDACLCTSPPPGGGHWDLCPITKILRERDEALALLSKAREALRVADENLCGGCEPELADLAKILGTGETT